MRSFKVGGMSCAACSSRVEASVSSLSNVTSCNVNLLTATMVVEGDATDEEIINAVVKAGYSASLENPNGKENGKIKAKEESEAGKLFKRFLISAIFSVALMYFSMGYTMWHFPLPQYFENNPIIIALIQMALALTVMIINNRFFINGVKSIIKGGNMGTLVTLGSSASFIYSLVKLFTMIGKSADVQHGILHEMYFESAAMVLTLITLGKALEAYSKGKTTSALKELMDLSPKTATVIRDGKEVVIEASGVKAGDVFLVRPGQAIPTDGVIIEGQSSLNESALTGESMPVSKKEGDTVYCATINEFGFIKCKATKESGETLLQEIINTVKEAANTKAPVQKIANRVSGIFVPVVIGIALITMLCYLLFTDVEIGMAIERGVCVLLISCPCALGLATPVAIMVGSGVGAKNGILFKTATALEEAGKVNIIALDKTGTITEGAPSVTDVLPCEITSAELIKIASSAEAPSEHPLSVAITKKAKEMGVDPEPALEFEAISGLGIRARLEKYTVYGGNFSLISEKCEIPTAFKEEITRLSKEGKTPLMFATDNKFIGIIAVADKIKEDSREAIATLKDLGLRVVMITGDNLQTAKAIANQVGIDEVASDVLPTGKGEVIKALLDGGKCKVAMVGDGINDAPALTLASVGIAIGGGTDIAMESADIVLTKSSLMDACTLIKLSRSTLSTIKGNLFWAFFYNLIGITLATGAFAFAGLTLTPMFGAFAMSLSSLFVVLNALRLNTFKPYVATKKEKKMTFFVDGIMCAHCEMAIKEALLAIPQIAAAEADHKTGTVKVELKEQIDKEIIKEAIEKKGFTVKGNE